MAKCAGWLGELCPAKDGALAMLLRLGVNSFRMGEEKRPNLDIEFELEDNHAKKRPLWQTVGEKIVAKSEMLKNLEGDKLHVCILLFLYCLQGIPLGLKSSIPLILTRRSVPYTGHGGGD